MDRTDLLHQNSLYYTTVNTNMLEFLVILCAISLAHGCSPITEHDQTKYCRTQYAFTGTVISNKENDIEAVFRIRVNSNIKERLASPGQIVTVYGRGTLNSCGPTRLDRNKEYILYVSIYDASTRRPEINEFYEATATYVNRINNYDCSCEVEMNLPWQPSPDNTTPAKDKCVITRNEFDCSFEKGYCARRRNRYGLGPCRWIAPDIVCPQN